MLFSSPESNERSNDETKQMKKTESESGRFVTLSMSNIFTQLQR